MKLPYIITPNGISVVLNNKMRTIHKDSPSYAALREELVKSNQDLKRIEELLDVRSFIAKFSCEGVEISDDAVYYKGKELHGAIVDRLLNMLRAGDDLEPLSRFLAKLMQNPSQDAVNELYQWLEAGNAPICEDGDFLAFKRVRADYKDVYSGTMDNSVGKIVEMPRSAVNPDRNALCSRGLHFCQHEYLKSFGGGRTVIVKINPADVVSIPIDYNFQKGRTWRYEVVAEVDNDESKTAGMFDNVNVDKSTSKKAEVKEKTKAKKPKSVKKNVKAPKVKMKAYGEINGVGFTADDIRAALEKYGSERKAAAALGITRAKFRRWIEKARADGFAV